MARGLNVVVRQGKAYIPTLGRTPDGIHVTVEPVYSVELDPNQIATALEKVISGGTPDLPTPSRDDFQRYESLIPRAAGVKTWRALARDAQSYAIIWEADKIRIIPSKRDTRGRWIDDRSREKVFPLDTSLATIADAILQDARARPELRLERNTSSS